jgi:bifunctional DNase/RNase
VSFPTIELRVIEVKTAVPAGLGVEAGIIGLQEVGAPGRIIRMVIGQPEARAIYSRWKGIVALRPSTWDLFVSAIEMLGGELRQVAITAVEEERHFFAALEMVSNGELRVLPSRPSDAVALAMRVSGVPIMTSEEVMSAAGVLVDGSKPGPVRRSDDAGATEPAPAGATEPAPAGATEPAPAGATEPAPAGATEPAPAGATGIGSPAGPSAIGGWPAEDAAPSDPGDVA